MLKADSMFDAPRAITPVRPDSRYHPDAARQEPHMRPDTVRPSYCELALDRAETLKEMARLLGAEYTKTRDELLSFGFEPVLLAKPDGTPYVGAHKIRGFNHLTQG